jgi:ribose-phosphate pyrophosphokinase
MTQGTTLHGGEPVYGGLAVYTGNAHRKFAIDICNTLEIPLGDADVFKFANDNIFVKINENVREHDVYIVQSLAAGLGVGVSDAIMELLIMIDACKRASAARITAVMPYYAYGRSDKKDQPRVPITARLLADLISVAGADRFLTMDMHQMQIQGFFGIPGDELSARNKIVEYLKSIVRDDKDEFALVVPDLGYANAARRIAELLDIPLVFMQKTHRDNSGKSEIVAVIGDIDRRKCIVIDDEIDRGTTMVNAIRILQERGVSDIWVAVTHAVLSGDDAAERLFDSGIVELVTTDTCPLKPSVRNDPRLRVLPVAPLFAEAIRRIHEGESVGALFNPPGSQMPLPIT